MRSHFRWLFVFALCAAPVACSSAETDATPAASATAATSPASPETQIASARPTACTLITAAEMSSVVGTELTEEPNGSTTCAYKPRSGGFGYVEVQVDWGGGEAAMTATAMLGRMEPGIAASLKGVGDQASAVGPALMIRTGEDLVTLTFFGVDRRDDAPRRVIEIMRPRMGTSAEPKRAASGDASGSQKRATSDEAREAADIAGKLLGGLLGAVNEQQKRDSERADTRRGAQPNDGARTGRDSVAAPGPRADEPTFRDAAGVPSRRIPLMKGLTIVYAVHEAGRGDYEPIKTIHDVAADRVSLTFAANLPEGGRIGIGRAVLREDLKKSHKYRAWFVEGDPETFRGTTAFSVSTAVFNDIATHGESAFEFFGSSGNPLHDLIGKLIGGGNDDAAWARGTLKRVEPHALAIPVLLNDQPSELRAIHVRGTLGRELVDFYILDDRDNPLVLRAAGRNTSQVVRIAYPSETETPLEEKLKTECRAELHGIYFDFNQATIRPESEPLLRDIATALSRNPAWKIRIEGHTDNIGGDAFNLDLSQRRAEAIRRTLIDRHNLATNSLSTAGFGASRPKASNDTLSGRAQNRRVELVCQ